jgi:hypothetical protein
MPANLNRCFKKTISGNYRWRNADLKSEILKPPQYNWNIVESGVKHHKPSFEQIEVNSWHGNRLDGFSGSVSQ